MLPARILSEWLQNQVNGGSRTRWLLLEDWSQAMNRQATQPTRRTSDPRHGLARCLDDVSEFLERYVFFGDEDVAPVQRDVTVLWIAHTYIYGWLQVSPRLWVHSPVKASGKTTLVSCLDLLVYAPVRWIELSDASFFRRAQAGQATFLLDEIDSVFGSQGTDRPGRAAAT